MSSFTDTSTRKRVHDLVEEVDSSQTLDEDAEELIMQLADDFIEHVVSASCKIAKHRKSATLETKDIQMYLERSWNMWIPGFGTEDQPKPSITATEAHKQRISLIKKAKK